MDKKQVEIGKTVRIGQVILIPIVEFSLNYWHGEHRFSCFCTAQPVFIVVVSPSWKRGFRANGEEVPLELVIEEIPGLREILEAI